MVRNGQNEAFYYRAEEVCPGTLSIVCIQDRQLSQALDGVVRSITAALLVSCVAVAGINLQRILNNDVDLEELQGLVESKRELKAELDALYGHVQINSHFLLNTLDSIYWSSVSRMGADSKESAMIGDLCEILKYALDSSDLYTSLREEVECTLRYIEIQQMRKNINRRLQVQFGGRSGVSLSAIEGGGLRVCLTMKYGVYEPDVALNKA